MKPMLNTLRALARNRGNLSRNLVRFSLLPTTLGLLATAELQDYHPGSLQQIALALAAMTVYAVNLALAILLYFHPPGRPDTPDGPRQ